MLRSLITPAPSDLMRALRSRFLRLMMLIAPAILTACGENAFRDPAGRGEDDGRRPEVEIIDPLPGRRIAVGDSIFVRVEVADDSGIDSVSISGFSVRGSQALGTERRVTRFQTKQLDLGGVGPVVRDTVILRYLLATTDSLPEDTVYIVARAVDASGAASEDTVAIGLGGPRIQIAAPLSGAQIRAGSDLRIRVTAADSIRRILSLRVVTSGGVSTDTTFRFDPPRVSVDTILTVPVPAGAVPGPVSIGAIARNTINDSTVAAGVEINLLGPVQDVTPPIVRFRIATDTILERTDTVAVTVTATDETRLDRVGVTILPIRRRSTGTDTLTTISLTQLQDSATFRVALDQLGLPAATDTSTLRVEVTAFALDAAGNCATATVPNTPLSEGCPRRSPTFGIRSGARFDLLVVRGQTLRVGSTGDRIADLAADNSNLYLSNLTRNRVEVLPIGSTTFGNSIAVGSRPWGLAFNSARSRLYVANSGGTNISVVSPSTMSETERIQTPNVKLYNVPFDSKADSVSGTVGLFPTSVTRFDYSDRPQFIGVTQNENLIFSTLPTTAATDGTVRVHRRSQDRLEIVTEYAEDRIGSVVVIANADSAFLVNSDPDDLIRVCPRNRSENPALDRNLPQTCFLGSINSVQQTIESAGYDTEFYYGMNIEEVGLSDTTFVAVSGDHSTVAFGEGARANGRVMSFLDVLGQPNGPLLKFGEIGDLVRNTAERVFGLALNANGSLGLARGLDSYFFSSDLRLQGEVDTDVVGGGVEMHPDNPTIQRAFISGVQSDGLAYIDVIHTFQFGRRNRIFLRDPVTGPLRAVRAAGGQLKIYAVTASGLVVVDVLANDL